MAIDWISNKVESARQSVSGAVGSATSYVGKKVDSAVSTAKQAAGDLYDRGKATLTSVEGTVSQTVSDAGQWADKKVGQAKDAAGALYDRGKAGLTQVGEALHDDSNALGKLKYANPMYYTGKATEYAGKGLKLVGEGLNSGVEFLDKNSKYLPEPLKVQAGAAAGVLGFAGGLVEGTGSLVDWAGRVQQGDSKTIKDTGHTLQKVGEGIAYIDGKAREGTGKAVEMLGNATDSNLLRSAGQGFQQIGKAEQSLAGDDTKKVLDTVGSTGAHYAMRLGEAEGKAVEWVGDKTGSQGMQEAGQRMQTNAKDLQAQTHTGLVDAIDKAAGERGKEYQENGSYAVTRDVTRVVAEVASLVVAPEALIGKAGAVAKTGEVANDVSKVVKAGEAVTETARVADKAGELGKAAETVSDAARVADRTGELAKGAEAVKVPTAAKAGETVKSTEAVKAVEVKPLEVKPGEVKPGEVAGKTEPVKAADAAPAEVPWKTEDLGNGMTREVREVPDPKGGPAWKETKTGGAVRRERQVPAQDGGPEWREIDFTGNGKVQRSREVPATDGGASWSEVGTTEGKTYRSRMSAADADGKGAWREMEGDFGNFRQRNYSENGVNWQETHMGNNRWRYREGGMDGLAREATAKGSTSIQVAGPKGPLTVNVHGAATPEEMARIQHALEAMPPAAREHAKDIFLSDHLGEVMSPAGKVESGVGGMAGDGRMVLDRAEMATESRAKRIMYHESGHNADHAIGTASNKPPWGNGKSVSKYGARNGVEDYAETHRVVLEDWQRYQNMGPSDWARESEAAKKMEIVKRYGGTVPSQAEIDNSSNILTRAVKSWHEFKDARNPG